MKTTELKLTITHKKPLPDKVPLTDIVAQRVYAFCYANGCEVGVQVEVVEPELDVESRQG